MEDPFHQWGLDFIGEIYIPSIVQHKWILTETNYFTKWIEVVPIRNVNDTVIMKLMLENIFFGFGLPHKPVTNNAQPFKYVKMINFWKNHNVILTHSTHYFLQGNGLVEFTNNILVRIIKNMLSENKKKWDSKLVYAL